MPMQAVSDLVVWSSGSLALETISSIVRYWRASLLSMIFIQLVDQTNVALAIVPTSSNDGDRFSLCCQTYEREREREHREYTHVWQMSARHTVHWVKPDVHAHRTVIQFNNNTAANVTAEPQSVSCRCYKV